MVRKINPLQLLPFTSGLAFVSIMIGAFLLMPAIIGCGLVVWVVNLVWVLRKNTSQISLHEMRKYTENQARQYKDTKKYISHIVYKAAWPMFLAGLISMTIILISLFFI